MSSSSSTAPPSCEERSAPTGDANGTRHVEPNTNPGVNYLQDHRRPGDSAAFLKAKPRGAWSGHGYRLSYLEWWVSSSW